MRLAVTLLTLLAVLATPAPASVSTVSTRRLSLGASVDVAGADFARPVRAWLESGRKRVPLRIARGASATAFRALLASHPARAAGEYDLAVRARGSRVPFHYAGITIERPDPSGVSPSTAGPGTVVTIDGSWFGARRGTVSVGSARARVKSWSDTRITFVVPPRTAGGAAYVSVANRAGAAEDRPLLTVAR